MICIHLKGGLGNQMFQYAAGRALADHLNTELLLDLTTYQTDKVRKFELSPFNIRARIAEAKDLKFWPKKYKKINKIFQKLGLSAKWHFEINFGFDENWFNLKDPLMLDGFYQSEKYFINFQNSIRNDFKLLEDIKEDNKNLVNLISNNNSVMIHVRRGDYINSTNNLSIHGICDLNYYKNAIKIINKKLINPYYFVFSDDITWCRDNFSFLTNVSYIEGNENNPCNDIHLMSICKNFIIANSSFSWWGAWLSSNKSKIVICPTRWFATDKINSSDICPSEWIRL